MPARHVTVEHVAPRENPWLTKLASLTHPPLIAELGAEAKVADVRELIAAAARTGFDGLELVRGTQVLRLAPSRQTEDLRLVLYDADWELESRVPGDPRVSRGPIVREHVGSALENAVAEWPDPPCALSVVASPGAPFFALAEVAFGVARALPCLRAFALGTSASPSHADGVDWIASLDQRGSGRVLTVRLPAPPPPPPKPVPVAPARHPVVREERDVRVDGVPEHWRIVWRDTPALSCLPAPGCGCWAVGYSQRGEADLVRSRPGVPDEVFSLSKVYEEEDNVEHGDNEAVLPAWPMQEDDIDKGSDPAFIESAQTRPRVTLMELHDFDHDGRATEFILHAGGVGCVYQHYVAVGISRRIPRLHAFGSATHPDAPLGLSAKGWKILEGAPRGRFVELSCGSHGGEEQIEIELRTGPNGIRGTTLTYQCLEHGLRLRERTPW